MRLERLSLNQFKIFLTFDDLIERGLTKDDLWHDLPRVHALFHDMMYEASDELGIELEGMLLVQVHLLQAQGMFVIVTQSGNHHLEYDDYVEMKVTLDESRELIFYFQDFEHIIQVCSHLNEIGMNGGTVYHMDGRYYMRLHDYDVQGYNREHIIAILSEFSNPSIVTSYRLDEYGKKIFNNEAIEEVNRLFK
ncbi:genetic competence negative regulator [Aquibacillus koreensis]|uniref:Genetic competence negative regulator n=1 Tax=Aquibacillus koreensis TaxID=279446 RepID=A0A9X4AGE3_9BACI|nr:genetic competence negative regulator [Aquibacillus koreensis]MCT2537410.1 genetic competence negative regulator [Aquibacillus koreensis]MDC3418856.1 genetic competence negative regulator [Aquibacillus koreensis]